MQADSSKQIFPSKLFQDAENSSANLDLALTTFLKKFFPLEVKIKQKENERDSGIDQYGEDYAKCIMM